MRHLTLLSLLALSGPAFAQSPPGIIKGDIPSAVFDASTNGQLAQLGATGCMAVSIYQMVTQKGTGVWTACITTYGLSTTYGGSGSTTQQGVVMGVYDKVKQTFTPTTQANSLNLSSGNVFGMHVFGPFANYAVVDQPSGPVIAERTTPTAAYGTPKPISGISATYVDPSLGNVNGSLKLFWVDTVSSTGIFMADLKKDTSGNWSIDTKTQVLVAVPNVSGNIVHSPTPIHGPDGDVEGLFLAERNGNESNMFFADDLDPKTPHGLVNAHTYWQNNGGVAGGMFIWADASSTPTPYYQAAVEGFGSWLVGDVETLNGTMDLHAGFDNTTSPFAPNITVVMLSGGLIAKPITLTGFFGEFGLDLTTLYTPFTTLVHKDASELASVAFVIPNDASLKGTYAIQGLSIQIKPQVLCFSNTAKMIIN
ncbi:MAG: hypothetical protein R3F30_14145 [Planctomycetota bacterium]